jgi:hypothetical protein
MCVGVVTMTGSSGDIETPGTITVGGLDFPPSVVSFSPADGATDVALSANIVITFDQIIEKATTGIGTTANITLRDSSGIGTVLQTIAVSNAAVTISGAEVTINPPSELAIAKNTFVVVDEGAFTNVNINSPSSLIDTYDFTTVDLALGDSYEGGFLICKASPLRWVVSPYSAEVSRSWHSRDDANTTAQSVSGCTGWFVPTKSQLQNPGYICRSFWGPSPCFSASIYWASSECNATGGDIVSFTTPAPYDNLRKSGARCVRSFRCVTY